MSQEVNIAQVSVKTSDTNHDLISLHQFLKIPAIKRLDLIKDKKIEFIDIDGERINLLDALRSITDLIKRLREEGTFTAYVSQSVPA